MRIETRILNPLNSLSNLLGSGSANQVAVFSGSNTVGGSTALLVTAGVVTIGVPSTGSTHTVNGDILFGSTNASDVTDLYRGSGSGALSLQGDNTATPSAISIYGTSHASLASVIRFVSANVVTGSISATGLWTIGSSTSAVDHIIRGAAVNLAMAGAGTTFTMYRHESTGALCLIGGSGVSSAHIFLYGQTHATKAGYVELCNNTGVGFYLDINHVGRFNGQVLSVMDTETGMTGTTHTINWNDANSTVLDLQGFSGNPTVTLTNPVAGASYLIKVIQGSTARAITWSPTIKWPGGVAPTISVANDAIDVIVLFYDGASYLGTFHQALA